MFPDSLDLAFESVDLALEVFDLLLYHINFVSAVEDRSPDCLVYEFGFEGRDDLVCDVRHASPFFIMSISDRHAFGFLLGPPFRIRLGA